MRYPLWLYLTALAAVSSMVVTFVLWIRGHDDAWRWALASLVLGIVFNIAAERTPARPDEDEGVDSRSTVCHTTDSTDHNGTNAT